MRGKIEGRGQHLVELAFTDELRNIGYEPLAERTEKWGKNFWDMYKWINKRPKRRLKFAKSAFPNLKKWYVRIAERPAVQKGYQVPKKVTDIPMP